MDPPNAPRLPSSDACWQSQPYERGRPNGARRFESEDSTQSSQSSVTVRQHSSDDLIPESDRSVPTQRVHPLKAPAWHEKTLDFVGAGSPLLLLILAGFTLALNGKLRSDRWDWVLDALLLAPSVFPVLFAMFTSRALASVALYVATKGTTLGRLEQLLGSQTLGGTIMTTYILRTVSMITLALFGLWAFSPLGGQAALRMLHVDAETLTTRILYRHPYQASTGAGKIIGDDWSYKVAVLYSGALIAAPRFRWSPRDVYGNVRIPMIEALDPKDADSEGWISVANKNNTEYSSLLGVPVALDIPSEGVLEYNMESRYFYFDCFESVASVSKSVRHFLGPIDEFEQSGIGISTNWMSYPARQHSMAHSNTTARELLIKEQGPRSSNIPPLIYNFYTTNERSSHDNYTRYMKLDHSSTFCSITMTNVEAHIVCRSGDCAAQSVRRSLRPHLPKNITDLDLHGGPNTSLFHWMGVNFMGGVRTYDQVTLVEMYLLGLTTPLGTGVLDASSGINAVVADVNSWDLSNRFTQAFNGFTDAYRTPYAFTGVDQSAFENVSYPVEKVWGQSSLRLPDFEELKDILPAQQKDDNLPFLPETTEGTIQNPDRIYKMDLKWLLLYILSVAVLTGISLVGAIFRNTNLAPDILSYVSTLTRDNPYTAIPEDADSSTLSGLERTRRLAKLPIVLTDVTPDAEYGHVALATMAGEKDGNGEKVVRISGKKALKKGRMFW